MNVRSVGLARLIVGVTAVVAGIALTLALLMRPSPIVTPSPIPSVLPSTAALSPSPSVASPVKGPPTSAPVTSVRCGPLVRYVAPTITTPGSVDITIPTDRRTLGGTFTLAIPPGPAPATPNGWTCLRFIPAVPAPAYVAIVASGTDGYLAEPSPTPRGEYANQAFLYYLTLPDPYRKSEILSRSFSGPDVAAGASPASMEAFTARSVSEEQSLAAQRCETACLIWDYVAVVEYFTDYMAPRQWYAKRAGATGETVEDITVDGRQAIRVTNGAPYPLQVIVRDGNFMFRVAYQIYSTDPARAPSGASRAKLDQIVASFHFTS